MISKEDLEKICKKLKCNLISLKILTGGAHNENILLETSKGRFVLRVQGKLSGMSLENEYRTLNEVKQKNVAPNVYLFNKSRKYIIEQFLEGTHPKEMDLELIIKMAKFFRKLHQVKTEKIPPNAKEKNHYSLSKFFREYTEEEYSKHKSILKRRLRDEIDSIHKVVKKKVGEREVLFREEKVFSLIHADPWLTNIIRTKKGIKMVDWEFARFDLKEIDLVQFIEYYCHNEERRKAFLKAYRYTENRERIRILYVMKLLSSMNWYVERLVRIKEGKVKARYNHAGKEEVMKTLLRKLQMAREAVLEI